MQKRVQQWESRFLSKSGKEILLKSIAQALPSFAMSVFLLPVETCKSMESIMSKFWWKSSNQNQGVTWASWNRLSKHKNEGGLGFRNLRDYNLAMLGKQAWRLISNEGSIVSRVYKARYYPQESFFSASLGCNPSFIWKSLFETKDLIKAGTIIHIGNGLNTSITSDPWLPDLNNPKITSTHPALLGQKVASLMCVGENSWDSEIINDLFDDRDKALILGIPLSQANREDCWSWLLEKSGIYSVKSAYRFLQQSKNNGQQNSALWKDFWKIEVPSKVLHFGWKAITGCLPTKVQLQIKHVPVDNLCPFCNVAAETIIHVLVYCPYANSCWIRSSISISTDAFVSFSDWFEAQVAGKNGSLLKEILMIAWAIWNARNKLVWDKKSMLAADVVLSARSTLNQWSFAHQRRMDPLLMFNEHNVEVEHWITPANDTIKVNVDGAIFEATNSFGFGYIARRSDGSLLEAASVGKIGRVAPEVAEVAGIKEALSWIKSKGWHKVSLESDCLVAVQAIHSSASLPSAFGQLVADCQKLLAALINVKVYFVKRSANKAAHFLARSSCYPSVRVFYDYNSPAELVEIVKNDSYI
uniref:RNase H type-1 domain-containing protein n=1 Tax=Cannabis sativa TaxID=3483 RepID=A0A803Q2U2_CANSA